GLYVSFVGRFGVPRELDSWLPLLTSSGPAAVVAGIQRSAEARTFLVKGWYQTFLGRQAVNGEEQGFVSLLLSGQTEEQVLGGILGSQEFFNRAQTLIGSGTPDERFVAALYQLLLNRAAAPGEIAVWVPLIPSIGRSGVARAIEGTLEYRELQV